MGATMAAIMPIIMMSPIIEPTMIPTSFFLLNLTSSPNPLAGLYIWEKVTVVNRQEAGVSFSDFL